MKTTRYLFLMLLITLVGMSAEAQQRNVLQVPDVTTQIGNVQLPVSIENTDEIVGAQFDLTLPEGVTAEATGMLANRSDGHTVTVSRLNSGVYRVLLHSSQNRPLRGQSGVVMYLPINIPASFEEGSVHPLAIANAVLGKATGENALTEAIAGSIRISKLPDLTVKNIICDKQTVSPGDRIVCSWQVENIGEMATGGGWTEQVSLVLDDGTQPTTEISGSELAISLNSGSIRSKLISTTHYDEVLDASGIVSRQVEITLPFLLGLDGQVKLQVRIIANENTGESASTQANNTINSDNVYTINKVLTLSLSPNSVDENGGKCVAAKLSRSGSWDSAETFMLTATADCRISVPTKITIPAKQSGSVFYIFVEDNTELDDNSIINISVEGNGYSSVSQELTIEDNEFPDLTLTASKSVITEGETFQLTVTTSRVSTKPIIVTLMSENTKRFSFPQTVTIAAGETSATVDVVAKENDDIELETSVAFHASEAKHNDAECIILLNDNDMPSISLTLIPTSVSESAGPTAMIGIIKRVSNIDKKVTIVLSDDGNGDIYYSNKTIVMEKGVESIQFSLGIIDNANVDGNRTVNVTAAIYASSCNCSVKGDSEGAVSVPISIIDDDGPSLKVVATCSSWLEGSEKNVLTISRNTSTEKSLTVRISSDKNALLDYEKEIVIPAGKQSVDVTVAVKSNDQAGDDTFVSFTVKSEGYADGACWIQLTDQSLPDAVISSFTSDVQETEAGGKVKLTIQLSNVGNAILPAQTPVMFSFSGDGSQTKLYTQTPIEPGESIEIQKEVTMPQIVGTYDFNAVVNQEKSVKELIYANNEANRLKIILLPNFTATVQVDKEVYNKGETVKISGHISGANVTNAQVEIYIINDGLRVTQNAITDANGDFSIVWQPYAQQCGHFIVGACFPNEKKCTEMDAFDVYGMRFGSLYYTHEIDLEDTAYGEFRLTNPGVLPLSGLTAKLASESDAVSLTSVPSQILGGETVTIKYSVKGKVISTGGNWINVPINVMTNEGVGGTFNVNYYVYSLKGKLTASESSIRTTMVKGQSRDYPITIGNNGKGETGKITIDIGNIKWLSCATPIEMASLKSGETTTAILRFTPTEDMQLNNPVTCQLAINCENGDALVIPMVVEPVSDEIGVLTIDVCDEYTYNTVEAPHVAGAKVTVQHPTTYTVIQTGITGDDGKCSFTLPEGYYLVTVTEARHEKYANNIMVDPGTETVKKVNIGINGVSVDMRYESTEIEDQYEIVTTVKYETNVPIPVVETIVPQKISADELEEGESLLFYAVLTNKGLITALNTHLVLPESDEEFEIVSLGVPSVDLAPQQSITIPVKVTRRSLNAARGVRKAASYSTYCYRTTITYYDSYCGEDYIIHHDERVIQFMDVCVSLSDQPIHEGPIDDYDITRVPDWPYVVVPDLPSYPPTIVADVTRKTIERLEKIVDKVENFFCDPCVQMFVEAVKSCTIDYAIDKGVDKGLDKLAKLIGWDNVPIAGALIGCGVSMYSCHKDEDKKRWQHFAHCTAGYLGCTASICEDVAKIVKAGSLAVAVGATATGVGAPVGAGAAGASGVAATVEKGCNIAKKIISIVDCMMNFFEPCKKSESANARKRANTALNAYPSFVIEYQDNMRICQNQLNGQLTYLREIYNNDLLITEADPDSMIIFFDVVGSLSEGELLNETQAMALCPENIDESDFRTFIQRINNTIRRDNGEEIGSDNYIHLDVLERSVKLIEDAENEAYALGFASVKDLYLKASDKLAENINEERNSICSSITLKLSQTMTMTRQAIRGTLTVYNGNEDTAMSNVKLSLVVRDADGIIAGSNLMAIVPETLNGFEGQLDLTSGWSLAANSEGTATILFIPTKYAAPTESRPYTFTGTISYIDPFTGLEVTRELAPATLTVNPSPTLDLTYFMQRDIYGDDPLTLDKVEASSPAEFTLLINNKGYGDANNVRMVTNQPEIIENEKGLANKIVIVSSMLNGEGKALSLGQSSINNDFGTIPAHSQAYAQWWLESDLLGHFTDYKVDATHVTSYGNEDLSLLEQVTIHELTHGFDMPEGSLTGGPKIARAFLANDIADANDLPDKIYFSNGDTASVAQSVTASIIRKNSTECELTITPSTAGWNYGSVLDPTHGYAELKSIVRKSDGKELGSTRFWQTDRILRDGKDWLYEYRLHFVDDFASGGAQTYVLTFDPLPETVLAVKSIGSVPAEGEIAKEPIKTLTLDFNKEIDATTFTGDDITFAVQGVKKDASQIAISTKDNKQFILDMSAMNDTLSNGYYTMTIQTADITDAEGYKGKEGKQTSWILFRGGMIMVNTDVWPASSGCIEVSYDNPASARRAEVDNNVDAGTAKYGSIITFTAHPDEGYQFLNWTLNDEIVSTEPIYTVTALSDMNVVANFSCLPIPVEVEDSEGGHIEGIGSGIYDYHADLTLTAVADEDYVFKGWTVNGEAISETSETLKLQADKTMTIKAVFDHEFYRQTLTLPQGWNWVSSYISEPWPVDLMSGYANRIVGQFNELINDPEYGLVGGLDNLSSGVAYKVEASTRFSTSFRGHLLDVTKNPVGMRKGWNWVPYPSTTSTLVENVITNAEEGDYLVGQTGFTEYADGYWEGTLTMLVPGRGYLYKSTSDKSLAFVFSSSNGSRRGSPRSAAQNSQFTVEGIDIHSYPCTMNITARVYRDGYEDTDDTFIIYAMAGEEVRGISEHVGCNYYLTVYGDKPVDITFLVESVKTGVTLMATETLEFREDVVGSRKAPLNINIGETNGIYEIENGRIKLGNVVYDLQGRKVYPQISIPNSQLKKGVYIVNGHKRVVK